MTFKEFSRWVNERACDGQWGIQHIIATTEIYDLMRGVRFFKKKFWKENCEERANQIVESVNRIQKQLGV